MVLLALDCSSPVKVPLLKDSLDTPLDLTATVAAGTCCGWKLVIKVLRSLASASYRIFGHLLNP